MSYNTNILGGDQPTQTRTVFNTNFSRIKTIVDADHQWNDSADATDGQHTVINHKQESVPAAAAICKTYSAEVNSTIGDIVYSLGITGKASGDGHTPLTSYHSNGTVTLGTSSSTDLIDFTGVTRSLFEITFYNVTQDVLGFYRGAWDGVKFRAWGNNTSASAVTVSPTGNKMRISNSSAGSTIDVFWTINFIRLDP